MKGVVLVLGALIADAAIGNVQEKEMKLYKASNIEVASHRILSCLLDYVKLNCFFISTRSSFRIQSDLCIF